MADLVRDDIGLREIPGCAEPLMQLAVEGHVEVDLLVERAVEGPRCRARAAALGLHRLVEQHEPGCLVVNAVGGQQL